MVSSLGMMYKTLSLFAAVLVCCVTQTSGQANSSLTTAPPNTTACDVKPLDIVFILDASGSVGSTNFITMLRFVDDVVQGLTIGPFDARIGLLRFADSVSLQFHLNRYSNKQDVLDRVMLTRFSSGNTNTYQALAFATDTSFTRANGMRAEAAQIAIVITDGKSGNPTSTLREAQRLKDKGVTVFSIGVGSGVRLDELNGMASEPIASHVHQVADFNVLGQILSTIQSGACTTQAAFLCSGQADIVFLLDNSDSIGRTDFSKMLQFVLDVANDFIIGGTDVQVGVDTFASAFKHEFYMRQASDKAGLQALVSRIPYTGGNTNTAEAILRMRTESFTPSAGHRGPGVPRIGIVVTDGKSADKARTIYEAQRARADGITLLVIGIGPGVDDDELNAIATDPDSQNVHRASSFDALSGLEDYIAAKACAVVEADVAGSVSSSVCVSQADIVFVIDTSYSVGTENFRLFLSFINTFLQDLEIGAGNISVGILKFGSRPYNELNLNRYNDKLDLTEAVNNIQYVGGGTDTGAAIRYMDSVMFQEANGDRPGVPNIGIIMSDGESNKPYQTRLAAERARANGITLFSVGVGDQTSRDELNDIANDPDNAHVLTVRDFTKLNVIKAAFQTQMCQAIQTIPAPPANASVVPPPPPPILVPDQCQDRIPKCAAYDQAVCNAYPAWASTFCRKTCGVCVPSPPVVAPPCVDQLSNCSDYDVSSCGDTTWASENCRKFCGYCDLGTQTGGFFDRCLYKGVPYDQGEQWDDGCAHQCECTDASKGQYTCYNKCPSFYNLPHECTLVKQPGKCCREPVCNFGGNYNTSTRSEACVYNGRRYGQNQVWLVGCQDQCICQDATFGSFTCQSLCAQYDWLPSNCRLVKQPGECCETPVCDFDTSVGTFTGSGGASGPGSVCEDRVPDCSVYDTDLCFSRQKRPLAMRDCQKFCNLCTQVAPPSPTDVCVYKGRAFLQGEVWNDGCDRVCTCDNAAVGYVRCQDLCPDFLNLPTDCSLVAVPGRCCRALYCETPKTISSSQTDQRSVGADPDPAPPRQVDYPSLPPGEPYSPGLAPNSTSAPIDFNTPEPGAGGRIKPPVLKCGPVEEGKPAILTCTAEVATCPNAFVMNWRSGVRDLAECTSTRCGGAFLTRDDLNVTITDSGSTVTIEGVNRTSPYVNTTWGCEFCGGSEVTCDTLDIYAGPENPTCEVQEDIDKVSGDIKSVSLSCKTSRVYPRLRCTFGRMTDGGKPVAIAGSVRYTQTATGETPTHYRSNCSITVPVRDLGPGKHFFQGLVYPDVVGGEDLATPVKISRPVTLSLPRAFHTCPSSLTRDYLCGKPTTCNCTLSSIGYPRGKALWSLQNKAHTYMPGDFLVVQYSSYDPETVYTCEGVSALGRTFGSKFQLSVKTKCG